MGRSAKFTLQVDLIHSPRVGNDRYLREADGWSRRKPAVADRGRERRRCDGKRTFLRLHGTKAIAAREPVRQSRGCVMGRYAERPTFARRAAMRRAHGPGRCSTLAMPSAVIGSIYTDEHGSIGDVEPERQPGIMTTRPEASRAAGLRWSSGPASPHSGPPGASQITLSKAWRRSWVATAIARASAAGSSAGSSTRSP